MEHRFLRTEMVLGDRALDRLSRCHVAVFGLGGVGSYAAEILARSGVGELTLVDQDTLSLTNINRQLYALSSTVGEYKAEAAARRCRDINPGLRVHPLCATYDAAHRDAFFTGKFDYIADCIDLVTCKLDLIAQAGQRGIPIISALGTGNKLDPGLLQITDISRTSVQRVCGHDPPGAAGPGHPAPEGGVQSRAGRRDPAAGGPVPRAAQRARQRALGALHRRHPDGLRHCPGPDSG